MITYALSNEPKNGCHLKNMGDNDCTWVQNVQDQMCAWQDCPQTVTTMPMMYNNDDNDRRWTIYDYIGFLAFMPNELKLNSLL